MQTNKLKPCNCFLCKSKRLIVIEFSKYPTIGGNKEHLLPWSFPKDLNNYYKEFNKNQQIEINKINGYENVIIHEGNLEPIQSTDYHFMAFEEWCELTEEERININKGSWDKFAEKMNNKKLVEQIMQAEKKAEIDTKQRVDNFVIETIKKHFE